MKINEKKFTSKQNKKLSISVSDPNVDKSNPPPISLKNTLYIKQACSVYQASMLCISSKNALYIKQNNPVYQARMLCI